MEEGIKQDGQKTVVAFIAGLLIGGLLVWVFSASPEDNTNQAENADTTITDNTEDNTTEQPTGSTDTNNSSDETVTDDEEDTMMSDNTTVGEGAISVSSQPAGGVVTLDEAEYPTTEGWVVIHEYDNGTLGNALGAARYSTTEGLLPEDVRLLRVTEAGNTYLAVYYSESGDRVFDLDDDHPIEDENGDMISDTFTAEAGE